MKTLYAYKCDAPSTPEGDWHHADIESAVKRKYGSYAGLARAWSSTHPQRPVSRYTLVKSAHQRQSELGEGVISWAIGVPAAQIWPSRYDANGRRIKLRRRGHGETGK